MHASSSNRPHAAAAHATQELLRRLAQQSGQGLVELQGLELEAELQGAESMNLQRMAHALHNDAQFMQQAMLAASERIHKLEAELARARALCCEDELTGCLNRRGLEQAFDRERSRSERGRQSLCVALIDIDDFKQVNDELGHAAGDQALVHLTRLARAALRASDVVGRWGGEEFVLLLPDTGLTAAVQVVERLRLSLRRQPLHIQGQTLKLAFSGGLTKCAPGEDCDTMLRRADEALYAAKRAGKDRIIPTS